MDITKELQEAKARQQDIVDHINQLKEEEQNLLREALRSDGEIRILQKLLQEANDAERDVKRP